jgi:two-component sensor histidine kinase
MNMPRLCSSPFSVIISSSELLAPLFYADSLGNVEWANRPSPMLVERLRQNRNSSFEQIVERMDVICSSATAYGLRTQPCRVRFAGGLEQRGCMAVVSPDVMDLVERHRLVTDETAHRARNILTVVSTIASQTLGGHIPNSDLDPPRPP